MGMETINYIEPSALHNLLIMEFVDADVQKNKKVMLTSIIR